MEPGGQERSPGVSPERCLAAVFAQALAVVSACTALADPSWLLVQVEGRSYVYGPGYVLHLGLNLTEPGPHHLLHKKGLDILVLILFCCYVSILIGFAAFLLDFLDTRFKRLNGIKVPPILHFTTVLSSGAAVAQCIYLYIDLYQEVRFQVLKPPKNYVTLGESFYFALCACVTSLIATALSLYYPRRHRREYRRGTHRSQAVDTSPLLQEPETTDPPGEYG
ncbi:transmembrane protein 127-like [Mixophyes fleayi]|uniref:transmembrane protein 127-like n=1 Tax=Mixophyes fleayi TaxID=3061075 RepID=UPI003F4DFC22